MSEPRAQKAWSAVNQYRPSTGKVNEKKTHTLYHRALWCRVAKGKATDEKQMPLHREIKGTESWSFYYSMSQ